MHLTICHLYPDVMNLYGDRGNLIALQRRAQWRGIGVHSHAVLSDQRLPLPDCDLLILGGGEDRAQQAVIKDLMERKETLRETVASGTVVLAVCGGYQLLGHSYRSLDGQELTGLGLLDVATVAGQQRLIGNVVLESQLTNGPQSLVGFENHAGRTHLGGKAKPLGRVKAGHGNNGEDGWEGAYQGHVFGTYLHGSLLPKNPWFTDLLLAAGLERRYGPVVLSPLDDSLEQLAHDTVRQRILRTMHSSRNGKHRDSV